MQIIKSFLATLSLSAMLAPSLAHADAPAVTTPSATASAVTTPSATASAVTTPSATASAVTTPSATASASADAFQASLRADAGGPLHDNFPVSHFSYTVDANTFQRLATSRVALREFVSQRVRSECIAQNRVADRCHAAARYLSGAWVVEERSGFVAAHRFATSFIAVSEDNWFGFEHIAAPLLDYLTGGRRELHLYQGFNPNGVLVEGGVPLIDLPVVLDHDERTVTIWTATLFD